MKRETNVPQSGRKLRELRESSGKTQSGLAVELEVLLKPHMKMGYTIQQADISRLELEETGIDIPKLLAYAHYFKTDMLNFLKPSFQSLCKGDIHLQSFDSKSEANDYLCQLEEGGRILVYSHFPSDFFCTHEAHQRYEQIAQPWYQATEIYTIDAYLSFLFSPVSDYSLDEKSKILNRYLDYFRNNLRHHLRFFSRVDLPDLRLMSNMEVLPDSNALLIPSPLLEYDQGDAFFEIRSEAIFEKTYKFYQQLTTLDSNLILLRIGLETLEHLRGGGLGRDAIRFFYQEVSKRTFDSAIAVLDNFSPEIKIMLEGAVGELV